MMKNMYNLFLLIACVVLMVSCSTSQNLSSYDDVYYSPGDEILASVEDEYIDIDDRDYVEATPSVVEEAEYYDPDYRENDNSGARASKNYYEDDDFHYSNRMRRFNMSVYSGFNYYDPYFSYSNWNSYDPYFWTPRPLSPYAYRPGWGFGWNNQFGWTASLSLGYGGFNPYGGYGYGYNPWGYYGNVYCPPYGSGYAYNDFYSAGPTYYRGQYNSIGSYTSSSTTSLGRGGRDKAIELSNNTVKPSGSASLSALNTRPYSSQSAIGMSTTERPREQGVRPVDYSNNQRPQHVAGARPANDQMNSRPMQERPNVIDSPSSTRPAAERPNQYVRSDENKPRQEIRSIRDNGEYRTTSPKPRTRPSTDYTVPKSRNNSGFERSSSNPTRNSGSSVRSSPSTRSSVTPTRSTGTKSTTTPKSSRGKR